MDTLLDQKPDRLRIGFKHARIGGKNESFTFAVDKFFQGDEIPQKVALVVAPIETQIVLAGISRSDQVAVAVKSDSLQARRYGIGRAESRKRQGKPTGPSQGTSRAMPSVFASGRKALSHVNGPAFARQGRFVDHFGPGSGVRGSSSRVSSVVASKVIASPSSAISSVASAPMMCAPRILAVWLAEDQLDKTFGIARRDRLAARLVGELADLELESLLLRLLFGDADAGHLRLAYKCNRGKIVTLCGFLPATKRPSTASTASCEATCASQGRPDDVARGIDTLDRRLITVVGFDVAAVEGRFFTPGASKPSRLASTPMATSRCSASSVLPPVTVSLTPFAPASVFSTLVSVRISIPLLVN